MVHLISEDSNNNKKEQFLVELQTKRDTMKTYLINDIFEVSIMKMYTALNINPQPNDSFWKRIIECDNLLVMTNENIAKRKLLFY